MAQFEWRVGENGVEVRIPEGSREVCDFVLLETLRVNYSQMWGVTIEAEVAVWNEHKGDYLSYTTEEDPEQYDETGKEAWRSLLRKLGYKRSQRWEWKRP